MYIERIVIKNFRIYYGLHTIELAAGSAQNINIISGNNGSGKTSILTSLVWCLYGKQMQEVDKSFKDRVVACGGYRKYLLSCVNRRALANGHKEFSVSINLIDVELPGMKRNSVQVTRTFNIDEATDKLNVEINGNASELVDDLGAQIFVQDFILPKEIAKFFFFDAERIVAIAEIQSSQEKKVLSQAYTEVLGIKKYEDLRNGLSDLRIRFRKDSASDEEKLQFNSLGEEISRLYRSMRLKEAKKDKLIKEKLELKSQSEALQEKLIREGDYLLTSEFNQLHNRKSDLEEKRRDIRNELREALELAPFAIAGKLITDVEKQVNAEYNLQRSLGNQEVIKEKIEAIIESLRDDMETLPSKPERKLQEHYVSKVRALLYKNLVQNAAQSRDTQESKYIHDFTEENRSLLQTVMSSLRDSYKDRVMTLKRELKMNLTDLSEITSKLSDHETKQKDALISDFRVKQQNIFEQIRNIDSETMDISQSIGSIERDINVNNKVHDELAKKIKLDESYLGKDRLASHLVDTLNTFIQEIKAKKKHSLEKRLLSNLKSLMHKKSFIHKVVIGIDRDIVDIRLLDGSNEELHKEDLSKGEQQLYATALLKSLVEESGIDFPVFVDSPLQKFDTQHAHNIITDFYPNVSKQVVIFPILHKEITKEEYKLIVEKVASAYIIKNIDDDSSELIPIDSSKLFFTNIPDSLGVEHVQVN